MMRMISFLDDSFLFKEERKGRIKECVQKYFVHLHGLLHIYFLLNFFPLLMFANLSVVCYITESAKVIIMSKLGDNVLSLI